MDEKLRVTVDIYGTQYTLTGHNSAEYMRRVAALVNEQMSRINSGSPRLDLPRLAVLAAVNMGDELLQL
ncbi:MAG: cell division protein ZapA, partial [Cohnella sp.]|nr:cell division protein ZapA [Cohnella sp.]